MAQLTSTQKYANSIVTHGVCSVQQTIYNIMKGNGSVKLFSLGGLNSKLSPDTIRKATEAFLHLVTHETDNDTGVRVLIVIDGDSHKPKKFGYTQVVYNAMESLHSAGYTTTLLLVQWNHAPWAPDVPTGWDDLPARGIPVHYVVADADFAERAQGMHDRLMRQKHIAAEYARVVFRVDDTSVMDPPKEDHPHYHWNVQKYGLWGYFVLAMTVQQVVKEAAELFDDDAFTRKFFILPREESERVDGILHAKVPLTPALGDKQGTVTTAEMLYEFSENGC